MKVRETLSFKELKAKSYKLKANQGFALVELLVAVVLFGVVAGMVLVAYGRVSEQLYLGTLAYEVALSLRQAQSFGVAVRAAPSGGAWGFEAAYGVHADREHPAALVLFADRQSGGVRFRYDGADDGSGCLAGGESECLSLTVLLRGHRIGKFCGVLPDDGGRDAPEEGKWEECNVGSTPPSNPSPDIAYLDVLFLRPNPDAIIRTDRSGVGERYKAARLYLSSPRGDRRVVEVTTTGQISVK